MPISHAQSQPNCKFASQGESIGITGNSLPLSCRWLVVPFQGLPGLGFTPVSLHRTRFRNESPFQPTLISHSCSCSEPDSDSYINLYVKPFCLEPGCSSFPLWHIMCVILCLPSREGNSSLSLHQQYLVNILLLLLFQLPLWYLHSNCAASRKIQQES